MSIQTLDLRFGGKLDSESSEIFNKLAFSLRSQFNEFIATISNPHKNNLDWWVEGPACRNTYSSPLFHRFCFLHFIKYLIDNKNFSFSRILVDSLEFKYVIELMISDLCVIDCMVVHIKPSFRRKLKDYLMLPILIVLKIIQLLIAKRSGELDLKNLKDKQLILIDTYMIAGYTQSDRWYGLLWENISDVVKKHTYFVPTLAMTPISKMVKTYNELRNNKRNFLIKEDFLNLSDIIYAAQHQRRIKKIKIHSVLVLNYEINNIVKEELINNSDKQTVIESVLTYCFVKNLKDRGLNVRLAIDWFEGQANDKAWNYSFNSLYSKIKTIGYREECFPFYLCSFPLQIEREAKVLPDVMAVQGSGSISTVREFVPDLEVIVIPSFRSQHVWEYDFEQPSQSEFTVLITLPIVERTAIHIIKQILDAFKKMLSQTEPKTINFIIKPHPTHDIEKIITTFPHLPKTFEFSEDKLFPKLLQKSSLLITEASATCLEALACGIPVIIVENDEGLTFDPIPTMVPESIVRKVRTIEQLANAMQKFIYATPEQLVQQKVIGKQVRTDYFEPLSEEGIQLFLNLENEDYVKYA